MKVCIYRPSRNAMQSGTAQTKQWILEYVDGKPRDIDLVMGWTGCNDTNQQLQLRFASKEDAVNFAKNNDYDYDIAMPSKRRVTPKSYVDNFATQKVNAWSLPKSSNA